MLKERMVGILAYGGLLRLVSPQSTNIRNVNFILNQLITYFICWNLILNFNEARPNGLAGRAGMSLFI